MLYELSSSHVSSPITGSHLGLPARPGHTLLLIAYLRSPGINIVKLYIIQMNVVKLSTMLQFLAPTGSQGVTISICL